MLMIALGTTETGLMTFLENKARVGQLRFNYFQQTSQNVRSNGF